MTPGIERAGNYYRWVYGTIHPYIGKSVLEIGAGYGTIGKLIAEEGLSYTATDSDAAVTASLRSSVPGDDVFLFMVKGACHCRRRLRRQ